MNKLNIKEYQTKAGAKRYILRGAYIGTDANTGKQIKTDIRSRTKTGVKLEFERQKAEFKKNGSSKRTVSNKLFSEVAESFFSIYQLERKAGSIRQMRSTLDTYILPSFGKKQISKITTSMLQKQVIEWSKIASAPINGARKRKVGSSKDYKLHLNVISRIFKHAISLGLVESNPCQTVIVPKVKIEKTKREINFYTKEELSSLFSTLERKNRHNWSDEYLNALLRLLIASGIRIGEAIALYWSDIDFENSTVSISKTTVSHHLIQDSPKTNKSNRTIKIDSKAIETMHHWFIFQKQHFMKLGNPQQYLVFPTSRGTVRNYTDLRNSLIIAENSAGIKLLSFHAFRHSHASLCINSGMTYKVIQERLGHSTLQMTIDLYSHLENEKKEKELELFANYANF